MKFTLQAPFASVSGAPMKKQPGSTEIPSGGLVFMHTPMGGNVARMYVIPANPQTACQTGSRTIMTSLSRAWAGSLTDANRTAWRNYATAHGYVSGMQAFLKLNWIRQATALAVLTAPPAASPGAVTMVTPSAQYDVSDTTLTISCGSFTIPGNDAPVIVYTEVTGLLSGARQAKDNDYRAAASTIALSATALATPKVVPLNASIVAPRNLAGAAPTSRANARFTIYDTATGIKLHTITCAVTFQA